MKLYTYCQSSSAYRVRIALNLKGIEAEYVFVNLTKGEQHSAEYAKLNPQQLVPTLIDDSGHVLTQSLAIIEFLEESYPTVPLLPLAPVERARVRAISYAIASEIAPINNLKLRKYVRSRQMDEKEWVQHWIHEGFRPLEKMLVESSYTGKFCHGASPTMADCTLIPQVFNARRFGCDLTPYPTIARIDTACAELPAFIAAHPKNQPDAV